MSDAIDRCRREIAAAEAQDDALAYLVVLGVEDWRREIALIAAEQTRAAGGTA